VAAVRVAVCTNRPPAAVHGCLAALAAEGAPVLLIRSGAAEAGPPVPGLTLVPEPRPGLSAARNRALAAAAADGDEIVAFVDDDAEVLPGWWAALHAAWEGAGARVGCIGGPIRARFAGRRPGWLTDGLLPTLTTLDLGPTPLDLDPAVQAVYGANFSVRVAALDAAGGFDEVWGHRGDRPWFGEDDEAQLALVRAGWTVRYEPGPAVDHVIPPSRTTVGGMLRRRIAHGAAVGRRGRRPPRIAARWLASNAVLAPVALARGDRGRAMERAVNAAENLGVLLHRRVGP
jgi:succinoglycan biosynthesis protein ExoM